MTRIVGIDLSLTSTGITQITRGDALGHTTVVRRITSRPPAKGDRMSIGQRSTRLRKISHEVTTRCAGADLVLIEGPAFASKMGSAHDRSGLWWLVVARLTGAGINVVEVPPSDLKTYATGTGNASKDDVLSAVVRRYPNVEFNGNDEADSLVLAAMGARFAGFPIDVSLPKTHMRALEKVQWQPMK